MNKQIPFLVPVLVRILHTNKFTSIGATIALIGVVLLKLHDISSADFLVLLGISASIIGYASKDGVRGDTTVAREDVPAMPQIGPTGGAVILLLSCIGLLSACSGFLSRQAPPVTQNAFDKAFLAAQLSNHVGSAYQPTVRALVAPAPAAPELVAAPDSIDLPPAQAHMPEAPYLVQPPAGLSKRERRQFLRAQRRALRDAARTAPAKVRLGKGAAYNAAPAGMAVAQKNIEAPVGLGPDAAATDNRKQGQHANGAVAQGHDLAGPVSGATTPPKLSFLQRAWAWITNFWPILLGLGVFAVLGWLRLGPIGTGLRVASSAAALKRVLPLAALLLASCATARTPGPAQVKVVAEGRDYHGFSLAPTICQQRRPLPKSCRVAGTHAR